MLTAADLDRIEKALAHAHKRDPIGFGAECAVTLKAGDLRALIAHGRATVGAELLPKEFAEVRERVDYLRRYERVGASEAVSIIDRLLADAVAMRNMLADALEERGGFAQGFEACRQQMDKSIRDAYAASGIAFVGSILNIIAALSAEDALAEMRPTEHGGSEP